MTFSINIAFTDDEFVLRVDGTSISAISDEQRVLLCDLIMVTLTPTEQKVQSPKRAAYGAAAVPDTPCPIEDCDFYGRGDLALGVHLAKTHGIRGASAQKRREREELIAQAHATQADASGSDDDDRETDHKIDDGPDFAEEIEELRVMHTPIERRPFDAETARRAAAEAL